jgi:energy-coupling factor transporter ATP-binding protein EcfA2
MAGFRKAKAEQAALKVGLYGPTGSGKTFTALLLAEGLAKKDGKRVAYVDTERGTDFYCKPVQERKAHPEAFDFDAIYSRSITEISEAVRGLKPSEYSVVVIDSMTHLWEAAKAAYAGRINRAGQIPFHAWGAIKKPYKDLEAYLISSPLHVFFCGRQANEFEEDEETGEMKKVGTKMKAEGDTPYEPHILIHMQHVRNKENQSHVAAFIEKDRTSKLFGKTIINPTYDSVVVPLLPLLGGTQAKIASADETASKDADALTTADAKRESDSAALAKRYIARMDLALSKDELEKIAKELTPEIKGQMVNADVATIREHYMELLKKHG